MADRTHSPNGRSHWAVKHKKKHALWAMYDVLVHGQVNPAPPKTPFSKATIEARCVVGAVNDLDNLLARLKPTVDWLVYAGYVVDDTPKHLEWVGMPTQRVSRKNTPEVEIVLTPVSLP